MSSQLIAAVVGVLGGLTLLAAGLVRRSERQDDWLATVLDLPHGESDVDVQDVTENHSPVVEGTVGFAERIVQQVDAKGSLRMKLQRARIPMKPGEYVVIVGSIGVIAGALVMAITSHWWMGLLVLAASPLGSHGFLEYKVNQRRKAFEAQLPDALSLIAASLAAGHTFLRSIQIMCEEADEPLASEFARVVSETQLGDPLVDALDRMAERVGVEDARWMVQAIRIQQEVGGALADLLDTLAEFMRAREEVRREVSVLTAEGRLSAWIVGGLPVFVFFAVQVTSPGYINPMLKGWGYFWLGAAAGSVAAGVALIQKMSKIKV
ncbi:MAG TPA: type II secretion system F family protein [Acidimicrobiales bacterium]|jgi:tight adherence protein B|nr:type II secretion system F family protein [Acidimicrobiales bacterium]